MSKVDTAILTQNLNPMQAEAVQTLDGPLLIFAGAGSGKTKVLTHRIANLIVSGKADPLNILAVTFTNKAAQEMHERVMHLLRSMQITLFERMWISTFHGFCNRFLRDEIHKIGFKNTFSILDDGEQLSVIKRLMNQLNISDKVYSAKNFKSRINFAKMQGFDLERMDKYSFPQYDPNTFNIFQSYEQELKKTNSLDFGDLLLKTNMIFDRFPDVLETYQEKFKYIMVDEYQDTNHIQYLLVKKLSQKSHNLCVVGDEDQSIYSWRGANIRNILDFEKDFPESVIVKLEENYRSTGNIVKAASEMIKKNKERKDKTLFTQKEDGDPITIREEFSEHDEAKFVVKTVKDKMLHDNFRLEDFAIFYRTNAQSRVLEEQFRNAGIPYKIIGGVRFYERMEIKDMIAYLRFCQNTVDDISFLRVINTPARGIGKTTVEKISDIAVRNSLSLFEATKHAVMTREFNSGTSSKLHNFTLLIDELKTQIDQMTPLEFYQLVLEKIDYVTKLKIEDTPESLARIENLEELGNAISHFEKEKQNATVSLFLQALALASDLDQADTTQTSVTMMTLHVSKGLEYPVVFVVGLEENLFPSAMRQDSDAESEMEEERRLAYVGMTRARQKLYLTYAKTRKIWGTEQSNPPSRFLSEIPKQYTEFSTSVIAPKFMDRYQEKSFSGNGYDQSSAPTVRTRKKGSSEYSYNSSFKPKGHEYGPKKTTSIEFQEFPDYETDGYRRGQRVNHPVFGDGSVYTVEGSGEDQKVSVVFADQSIKKFVAKYAKLKML
jgi:DNA helicase-2/ATP-dependent DNA helicase PcrA